MLARLRKRYEDDAESGFTLIELLVVMVIIGILAAIAIPTFLNQKNKSYDTAAKSAIRTIATAEDSFATNSSTGYTNDGSKLNLQPTDKDKTVWASVIAADSSGYCVQAFDSRSKTPAVYYWDSQAGGQLSGAALKADGTPVAACTVGTTAWNTVTASTAATGATAPTAASPQAPGSWF